MADCIDRDALIDNLQKFASNSYDAYVNNIIMGMPRANVKKIMYAHWICKPDCGVTECSACHRSVEEYVEYPHCMFCGAEMSEVAK